MRIVHVITKGDVGGAQTHVIELAGAQIDAGHDVHVIAGSGGTALDRCAARGVGTTVVPSLGDARHRIWQRAALADLRVAIERAQPDVVHAHSSNAGLLARLACRALVTPCVYTAHGWPFQRGAAWSQRALSLAGEIVGGRAGAGVICLTEAEAARARRARVARPDRLWVIPNGLGDVAPELVRTQSAATARLVMVARFAPPKRQRELVDVLAGLLDLEWSLTFVGDGPELDACRAAGTDVLGDRVTFLGHRDDVAAILAEHDVLVLWSGYEGLPVSILEGMRAGMCCVASDLDGVRVLFEGGVGELAGSPGALAAVLRGLLTDRDRRTALGSRARSAFLALYSIRAVERQVMRVYEAVGARRP